MQDDGGIDPAPPMCFDVSWMPPPPLEGHATDTRAVARLQRSADPMWWFATAVLTLIALWLRNSVFDLDIRDIAYYIALFLIGALVGAFCPSRPWRWPLAAFLTLVLTDFRHLSTSFQIPTMSMEDITRHLNTGGPQWVLQTLPVLAGAYIGSYMSQWGTK